MTDIKYWMVGLTIIALGVCTVISVGYGLFLLLHNVPGYYFGILIAIVFTFYLIFYLISPAAYNIGRSICTGFKQ